MRLLLLVPMGATAQLLVPAGRMVPRPADPLAGGDGGDLELLLALPDFPTFMGVAEAGEREADDVLADMRWHASPATGLIQLRAPARLDARRGDAAAAARSFEAARRARETRRGQAPARAAGVPLPPPAQRRRGQDLDGSPQPVRGAHRGARAGHARLRPARRLDRRVFPPSRAAARLARRGRRGSARPGSVDRDGRTAPRSWKSAAATGTSRRSCSSPRRCGSGPWWIRIP